MSHLLCLAPLTAGASLEVLVIGHRPLTPLPVLTARAYLVGTRFSTCFATVGA